MPALIFLLVILLGVYGWVSNLVEFTNLDFNTPVKAEVVRGVGIFIVPVGAVLGYIDIEDK